MTDTLDEFKKIVDDIHHRKVELSKKFNEFQSLQQEIINLSKQAAHDPIAAEKISRLNKLFSGGYEGQQKKMSQRVQELGSQLKKLELQFKQLGNSDGSTQTLKVAEAGTKKTRGYHPIS